MPEIPDPLVPLSENPYPPPEDSVPAAIERLDLVSAGPPQYEFTSAQSDILVDLVRKMRFVGMLMVFIGVLNPVLLWAEYRVISWDITFLILILIGAWTYSASKSFRQVVETKGNDINYLMDALATLRRIYGFIYYLVIIGIVLAGIVLFWAAFGGEAGFRMGGGSPVVTTPEP
jgi:hypothetical protein